MRWTYAAGVIPMAALAIAVAGCGSNGTTGASSSPSNTGTSSSPSSSGGSTPTTSAASPATSAPASGGETAAAGVPSCTSNDLKAKVGQSEGAAGSIYVTLDFTNTSTGKCTMYGYPGVSLANGTTEVGPGATRSTTTAASLITLAPNATANAVVQVADAGNYPANNCGPKPTNAIKIYPPNQTVALFVPYSTSACTKSVDQLRIAVVQSGS
jgi:Protein of unknown function (DUF4232)